MIKEATTPSSRISATAHQEFDEKRSRAFTETKGRRRGGSAGFRMKVAPLLLPTMSAGATTEDALRRHRSHAVSPHQCGAVHVQDVAAPLPLVWSLVRRFDRPQSYKCFVSGCSVSDGDGGVGSLRQVRVVSGLPAGTSTERLDALDDDRHVISFSVVGGDHRLANYRSTTSLHEGEGPRTVVVESYVVDVPPGSTEEETRLFADTIVRCNLRSLARVTERMAAPSTPNAC